MCMEDVRLGRKSNSRLTLVVVPAATDTLAVSSDPNRRTVLISPTDGSVVWLSDKAMTADATGLRCQPNSSESKDFRVEDHGDFVRNDIHVWSTAGCTLAVLETSLGEQ